MAIVIIPFVAVNVAMYGSVLPPYYSGSRLGSDVAVSFGNTALMYLVSPSRGLLIYDPLVVIVAVTGVWLRLRRGSFTNLELAVCAAVVGHFLVVADFGSTGGASFGPRLMTDMLPFLIYLGIPMVDAVFGSGFRTAMATRRALSITLVVLLGVSVLVNASWRVAERARIAGA